MRAFVSLLAVAGLLAVPAAANDEPPSWKAVTTGQNNIKQIALAFHNFESANAFFPQDVKDKDGKPILSWRVHILPYIEEDNLYKLFKLDEPWDSADNKKLIEKMPKLFAPVHTKAKAGHTFYQGFTGGGALFGGKDKLSIVNITDGTSNTALVVEAGDAVIWSKPADIVYDPKKPLPKLGGDLDGNFNLGFADGSVRWVRKGFDEKTMRLIITANDGELVDVNKLFKRD
jgi:prepilin-type processing-associated H-X9-DG protein